MRLRCLLLGLALLIVPDARAQQIKLRATLQVPITHPILGASLTRLKEEVEERTNNAISIEIFDKAQLANDAGVIDAVASGAVDMGMTGSYHFASKVPEATILDQPFLFNFAALVAAAATPDSEIRAVIDHAILTKLGVRVLWWQGLGNNVFFSKGKDISDPERMKGLRVGVPAKMLGDLVASCGGLPMETPFEALHASLQGGGVDGALAGISAVETSALWEITDTITRTKQVPVEFMLIINEKSWKAMKVVHRAAIADAAVLVEQEMRDRLVETEAKMVAFATSKGLKILDPTPDQVTEWRTCSAEMLADFMDRNGELAPRLMVAYGRLRTQACCSESPDGATFNRW